MNLLLEDSWRACVVNGSVTLVTHGAAQASKEQIHMGDALADFFDASTAHLRELGLNRLVALTFADEAVVTCEALLRRNRAICACGFVPQPSPRGLSPRHYYNLFRARYHFVARATKLVDVLSLDTDIRWRSDPRPQLRSFSADLLFQNDDPFGPKPALNEGVLFARRAAASPLDEVARRLDRRFTDPTSWAAASCRGVQCYFPQAMLNEVLVSASAAWRRDDGDGWLGVVQDARIATLPLAVVSRACARIRPRAYIRQLANSTGAACALSDAQNGFHMQMVSAGSRLAALAVFARGFDRPASTPVALSSTLTQHACVCGQHGCRRLTGRESYATQLKRCRAFRPEL